jgi:hypothetical protein
MLRAYIAAAKQYEPYVPDALTDYVAAVYAEMRAEEAAAEVPHSYTTARTLLSILRLSQALARLRFADAVEQVGWQAAVWGWGRRGCVCLLPPTLETLCRTGCRLPPAPEAPRRTRPFLPPFPTPSPPV